MVDVPVHLLAFDGLDAPLQVSDPQIVRPLLDPVMAAWPFKEISAAQPQSRPPFATIGPIDDQSWRLLAPLAASPVAHHDPVDAICDLVVEMSWERLRSRPDLLCLHAAAIEFGDHLVIFPNARRAGKSLLTATLAKLGHAVFSDDFVPVAVEAGTIYGLANGIAPRLRLPLPPNLPIELSNWIAAGIDPANKRYGYLTGIDLPLSGTKAPIGAVVLLDREKGRTASALLEPVSDDDAIAALVIQNFGRQVHAGAILSVIAAIATSVPVYRLVYDDVADAAALLHDSPHLARLSAATLSSDDHPSTDRPAPLPDALDDQTAAFDPDLRYGRVPGFVEVQTQAALYLADAQGRSIHRFNAVSGVIWMLLQDPMRPDDLADAMQEVFADVPRARLQEDVVQAMTFLWQQDLIVEAPK